MVRKIKAKLVLQLRNQSLSRRAIESAHVMPMLVCDPRVQAVDGTKRSA